MRLKIHPWVWAVLFGLLCWWVIFFSIANSQNLSSDRKTTKSSVRDLIKEPRTAFLVDTSLSRMVDLAQKTTMMALKERTKVRQDTIVTSPARIRYYMAVTDSLSRDTVMSGAGVAMIIQKDATAIGGKEHTLAYVPYEMVGKTLADGAPAFYTVIDRMLILGQSPYGGDTLFMFYNVIPRDLDNDTVSLTVAKEDQPAVIYMAAMLASLADKQVQVAQLYWNLWQAHTGFKGYPPQENDKGQ